MSVKRLLIGGAVAAVCAASAGIAMAVHVPQVDPTTVPPGFLATHNQIRDIPHRALIRIAKKERIQGYIQHLQVGPNGALPWHTHPGPVVVMVVEGTLIFEEAHDGACRQRTYPAGTGFVDRGFGHVHRAIGGPEGADFYATFLLPRRAETQTVLADAPAACAE
jgi:hypothetical protein